MTIISDHALCNALSVSELIIVIILCTDCHPPVSAPIPPPVDIQTFCDLVVWRNAPNISYDDITGYDIRLVNSAINKEVVTHVDASAMFYSLEELDKTLKSELTFVQVAEL